MASVANNKRNGAKAEEDGAEHLRQSGVPNAERRHLSGANDKGDIAGFVFPDGSRKVCMEGS